MIKAYLLVKETIPLGKAINSCAHAGSLIEKHFPRENDKVMQEWWKGLIRKVTCKVDEKTFEAAKKYEDWFAVTEATLDGEETVLVFKPRYEEEWPKFFKFLSLYK